MKAHAAAKRFLSVLMGGACSAYTCCAGAANQDADALAKQLANPVADLISVPFQLNWDTGLAENGTCEKWLLNTASKLAQAGALAALIVASRHKSAHRRPE